MVHTFEPTDCGGAGAVHQNEPTDGPAFFNYAEYEQIGVAIVEAVSAVSDVDPCQWETRLYDVVDPDALRQIVRTGGPDVQVSFRFGGYRVSVFGDGEITVTEAPVR